MGRKSKLPLILEALQSPTAKKRGLTQGELQQRCGISMGCVNQHVHELHAKKVIHICGWKTDVGGTHGGRFQARWRLGPGEDVPKPPPLTRAEIAKRWRDRVRASGEIEDIRAKGRALWWRKQPPRRDPLAVALYGSPA